MTAKTDVKKRLEVDFSDSAKKYLKDKGSTALTIRLKEVGGG